VRVVTVDELVNTVLQHNTGLNAARRAIDIATAGVTTAGAYPNPRLELNGGRGSALTPGTTSGSIVGVGVSQLIENPALRSARINSALFAEQGSQQAFATTRNELVGLVRLRSNENYRRVKPLNRCRCWNKFVSASRCAWKPARQASSI
jgi:cobalt-zinc-cadmium efflux system outer membrane protein